LTTMRERYQGTLLGLASADALGGAVEFMPRAALERDYPEGVREIAGGGPHGLRIGETTDDTAMALAIARACGPNGIDLDGVAANFLAWFESNPKDIGITTSRALSKLAGGVPWREIGTLMMDETPGKLAGNGAVMRAAPVALRFRHDREMLRKVSIDTARMTHPDPMATWGAVALNQAIAHLLDAGEIATVIDAAVDLCSARWGRRFGAWHIATAPSMRSSRRSAWARTQTQPARSPERWPARIMDGMHSPIVGCPCSSRARSSRHWR